MSSMTLLFNSAKAELMQAIPYVISNSTFEPSKHYGHYLSPHLASVYAHVIIVLFSCRNSSFDTRCRDLR